MLHTRNFLNILLVMLLLVQPVFATTLPETQPEPTEPDIITAVHEMESVPKNWSYLSPATPERQWLQRLTSAPVYELNADGSWTPVLALELPQDVTADYASTYSIPADAERGYAYRIVLNRDARWDTGKMISVDDYIFSIGKLLEDEEHRQNWLFLANAEDVLSGKQKHGEELVTLLDAGFADVNDARRNGYTDFYIDTDSFWGLDGGWRSIDDRKGLQDFAMPSGMDERFVSPAYLFARYLADGAEFSRFQSEFISIPKNIDDFMTMEDLGIIKINSFEMVLVLDAPMAPSALMEKLQNLFLFRKNFWGKNYATSPETYCGYGPYRITASGSGEIVLEPSSTWFGEPVSDEFDRIVCRTRG